MGGRRLEFGVQVPTLAPHEPQIHEYQTWAEHGAILYISPDGEEYVTVPKNASVLLQCSLPEESRKRKRVPANIEKLLLNNASVGELTAYGSQEAIISKGQTVYVPPNWFNTRKPKGPRMTQKAFRI